MLKEISCSKEIKYYLLPEGTISSPMQIGLFSPIILLPDIEYTATELKYVLNHELTHFVNRDNWIKLATNILICIAWWNPFSYLLIKELKKMLEYKCDSNVTDNLYDIEKAEYLNVLLSFYSLASANTYNRTEKNIYHASNALTYNSSVDEIRNRFQLVASSQKYQKFVSIPLLTLFVALFIFSYMFVLQPAYDAPIEDDDAYYLDVSNTVIRYIGDNQYEILYNGQIIYIADEEYAQSLASEGFTIIYD